MKHIGQLVADDGLTCPESGELQPQGFKLQLIAGDVSLECRALTMACLGVVEHFLRQSDVIFHHLHPVFNSTQIKIVRGNQEAYFLTVAGIVEQGHLRVESSYGYLTIYGTS